MNKKVEKRRGVKKKGVTVSKVTLLFFCVFFLMSSLSMFVLGVYIGRGQAPVSFKINDIRAEIAAIEKPKEASKAGKEILGPVKTEKKEEPEKKQNRKKPDKSLKRKEIRTAVKAKPKRKESQSVFSIQIGAFKFENDADALVKKLKSENLPAFKYINRDSKEVWYRVRVGSFKRREDAKKLLHNLKNRKFDAYLVR